MARRKRNNTLLGRSALVLVAALAVTALPAVASVLCGTSSTTQNKNRTIKEEELEDVWIDTIPVSIADGNIKQWAEYPGGEMEFYKYLSENINYPKELVKSRVSGRVVIQFTIGCDGTPKDFIVVDSLAPAANAEALRVVKAMPKWLPLIEMDGPKEVSFTLPIFFHPVDPEKADSI